MADMLSVSDALALQGKQDEGMFGGNNMWLIVLFLLLAFGGNGLGMSGNQALTQAELQRGFDTNTVINKLDGISNGICDSTYALNNTMTAGFNGVNAGLAQLGYNMQNCCCEINRNIDNVRFENAQNTCAITTAIHNDGEATRQLITQNTIQALRDELQSSQLQLSNVAQTQTILGSLGEYFINPPYKPHHD